MQISKAELHNIGINLCLELISEGFGCLLHHRFFIQDKFFSDTWSTSHWSLILAYFLIYVWCWAHRCIYFFVKLLSWCLTFLLYLGLNLSSCLFLSFSLLRSIHTRFAHFDEFKWDNILSLSWSEIWIRGNLDTAISFSFGFCSYWYVLLFNFIDLGLLFFGFDNLDVIR